MGSGKRVPAIVFASLRKDELRITMYPGTGHADYGGPDVPMELIPPDLRMPNTPLWIEFDEGWKIRRVSRRDP